MNNELREFWEEKTRKAVEKAERKKVMEFAESLLADGSFSYEKIAAFTGLTLDEVKNLASQRTA